LCPWLDGGTDHAWRDTFRGYPQMTAYYLLEFSGIAIGLVACLFMLRSYPYETSFSLAVIIISLISDVLRGMHRSFSLSGKTRQKRRF
jgi:hypothetical protein